MSISFPAKIPFSMMVKPMGSTCNLNCTYCYYLEKEKLYPANPHQWSMSEELLETYIAQTIYCSREPVVLFAWHGGEPILRGMDFFRKVIQLQKKHGEGRVIENSLQTNGTTLTDDWCGFFSDHHFLIGISIDGPEDCHDHYRVYKNGQGSFLKCMKGLELLVKHKVEYNTLSVVNDYTAKYPMEVYRFLKSIGSHYLQFLPVVEWIDPAAQPGELRIQPANSKKAATVTDWTVDPVDYGDFLVRIFDEWVCKDVGDYFVLTFDCVLANWMRVPPPVCVSAETCGNAGVVEYNGDVYACDHFVFPEYKLGNIHEKSLPTLMEAPFQLRFGQNKRDTLPGFCLKCEFLDLCNGECPKNRIVNTPGGEPGLNYLCPGFKKFYKHTETYFDFMANELQNKRPPSNVKKWASARRTGS
ncbi:MAG: anaerobic sulfatase-maturation protein [Bacteroidales bacterium]|nr:anaerobic sulfatase-maturation protein [Bacteroidales bacterium]